MANQGCVAGYMEGNLAEEVGQGTSLLPGRNG